MSTKKKLRRLQRKKDRQAKARAEVCSSDGSSSGAPQFLLDAASAINNEDFEGAIESLKGGIHIDSFSAYSGIGDIYLLRNENEKALEWLEKARQCNPGALTSAISSAKALYNLGKGDIGIRRLCEMMLSRSDMGEVRELGDAVLKLNGLDELIKTLEEMLEAEPERVELLEEIGLALKKKGKMAEAEKWYRRLFSEYSRPGAAAYGEFSEILNHLGHLCEAEYYIRKGMREYPTIAASFSVNLANVLVHMGRVAEAVKILESNADKLKAEAMVWSNILLYEHYLFDITPEKLYDQHRKWAIRFAPLSLSEGHHENVVDVNRRLRIGYVSSDFRMHSVSYFFEPLVDGHNREEVEVYGYGNINKADPMTARMQNKFDCCRNVRGLDDESTARMIRRDKIDILVDLTGHTAGNRLCVFAYKPAPVQITYMGYPDTTGLSQIDYRLADVYTDPAELEKYCVEQVYRMPGGFLCYSPPDFAPEVVDVPAKSKGYVTFGTFNNNAKVNSETIELWSRILDSKENSRFLFKFRAGEDPPVRERYLREFERFGISRDRIEICGRKAPEEHLGMYGEVDVALDTYPYNGTTTTCEALWMGVPVVSLVGRQHMSRVGLSLLSRVGLGSLAVSSGDEYVAKAIELCEDLEALSSMRMSMRERITESGLCNKEEFAGELEAAYRQMWRKWCDTQVGGGDSGESVQVSQGGCSDEEGVSVSSCSDEGRMDKAKSDVGPIRIFHNLARSGGTLVCKCIGCMEGVALLSEIHPLGLKYFNPIIQAHSWHKVLTADDIRRLGAAKQVEFADAMGLIARRCSESGRKLVVRDWAHLDFMAVPFLLRPKNRLLLAEVLGGEYEIKQLGLVRHPIDEWLSLRKLDIMRGRLSVDAYLRGYLKFAEQCQRFGYIRYEDFCDDAEGQMRVICERFGLEYDEGFLLRWADYKNITGDTGGGSRGGRLREIVRLERKPVEVEILKQFRENRDYHRALEMLDYEDVEDGGRLSVSMPEVKVNGISRDAGDEVVKRIRAKRIFISSMPRSGSMWTYNVVRELVRSVGLRPLPENVPTDTKPFVQEAYIRPVADDQVYCVKTHYPLNPDFADTLVIVTYRDVRDCVMSYMRFMHVDFERMPARAKAWMDMTDGYLERGLDNILPVRYDELVENSRETIRRIDDFIGTGVDDDEVERIARLFSRERVKEKINSLSGVNENEQTVASVMNSDGSYRSFDRSTGFQSNHITSMGDGEWRTGLTEEQQGELMELAGEWLEKHGFV